MSADLIGRYLTNGRQLVQVVRPLFDGAYLLAEDSDSPLHDPGYTRVRAADIDGTHWRVIEPAPDQP